MSRRAEAWSQTNHGRGSLWRNPHGSSVRRVRANLRRRSKSAFTTASPSRPSTVTSAKWRPSTAELVGLEQVHVVGVLEVGRRVRRDEEGGAVVASTRADSATWPSGSAKCSMRCDEHTQSKPPVRTASGRRHSPRAEVTARLVGRDRGGRVVVDAEHRAAAAEEAGAAVAQAAAEVEEAAGADPVEHLAVAGGVQRQQRVGGLALDRTLPGESQTCAPFGRMEPVVYGPRGRHPRRHHRQARRPRRGGRAAPHPHAGVARPRRRRGGRVRAARGHGRPAVGRGRHRGHDAHVVRAGPPAGERATATGSSARPAATWCSPRGRQRGDRPARPSATAWSRSGTACRSSRRCGRRAAASCSCTTSTARCGRWCCRRAWPRSARPSSAHRAAALPPQPHRHAVGVVARRARRRSPPEPDAGLGRAARHRPALLPARGGTDKSRTPLVVAVGRLVPVKRFDELIQAMAEVRATHPDVELMIVGDGAEREQLEELVDELDAPTGSRCPASCPTTSWSPSTARRGCSPARRRRGLGHDDHRGRRVRHAGGRHRHRRPPRRGASGVTGVLSADMAALARDIARVLDDRRPRARLSAAAALAARPSSPGRPPRPARSPCSPARRRAADAPGARRADARPLARALPAHRPRPASRTSRCSFTHAARSAPTPRRYLYLDPGRLLARRRTCGTGASASAPSPTRPSATCSRWARTTGSCRRLGVPDWVAQRLWLGTILFAAGAGVLFLLRTIGWRASEPSLARDGRRRRGLHALARTCSTTRRGSR